MCGLNVTQMISDSGYPGFPIALERRYAFHMEKNCPTLLYDVDHVRNKISKMVFLNLWIKYL